MKTYKISIDEDALQDIQKATDWYNQQLEGLGYRFEKQVKSSINSLKKNAKLYTIRYGDVRCVMIKKFPFMIHFTINNKQFLIEIFALFHTSRNPKIWEKRRQ